VKKLSGGNQQKVSDRIAVMYRGQIVTTVDANKVTREQLGLWMAGARPE